MCIRDRARADNLGAICVVQSIDDGCFMEADSSSLRKQSVGLDMGNMMKISKMAHGINYT